MLSCSGGLSNHIFLCSLPDHTKPRGQEPSQVLLRLYGANYGEAQITKPALNNLVMDNVIFTILSERKLGPKLFGVFAEGRLEEYIPSRSMSAEEISGVLAAQLTRFDDLAEAHRESFERVELKDTSYRHYTQHSPYNFYTLAFYHILTGKRTL